MEGKFDIFAVIGIRMDWLGQRRKVVAQRIGRAIRRAKDADQAAFRIREVAGDPGVPVVENPPVAFGTAPARVA